MLPPSHVAYTLVSLSELQKQTGSFEDADYRLVALAALAPDLIDKPFAFLYFYPKYQSSRLFSHTLIAHFVLLMLTLWKAPHQLVYTLSFIGHAVADRMWFFPDSWYWPWRGWRFHSSWRKAENVEPRAAYRHDFTHRNWGWEIGGILAWLWFIARNRLWQKERLKHLLLRGRLLPEEPDFDKGQGPISPYDKRNGR